MEKNGVLPMVGGGVYGLYPGQITDDTELAMKLAKAILESGTINSDRIAKNYNDWYRSKPFDIGNATRNSVVHKNSKDMMEAARKMNIRSLSEYGDDNLSNGMLMRLTPLAVTIAGFIHGYEHKECNGKGINWHKNSELFEKIVRIVKADTLLTHYSNEAVNYAVAYVVLIASAILHGRLFEGTYMLQNSGHRKVGGWHEIFAAGIDSNPNLAHDPKVKIGDVRIGFQLAVSYGTLIEKRKIDVRTALIDTIKLGGDTDTNACIVGGLIGAISGINAIPGEWTDAVTGSVMSIDRYRQCSTNRLIASPDTLGFKLFKIGYNNYP